MTTKLKLSTALTSVLSPELASELAAALPTRLMAKLSDALSSAQSPDMTIAEVKAYRKESDSTVQRKMRNGTYDSYLSGSDKRLVKRESVERDREYCLELGPRFDQGGKRGRPKKALESPTETQGDEPVGPEGPSGRPSETG
jgi:hypothetical protein